MEAAATAAKKKQLTFTNSVREEVTLALNVTHRLVPPIPSLSAPIRADTLKYIFAYKCSD